MSATEGQREIERHVGLAEQVSTPEQPDAREGVTREEVAAAMRITVVGQECRADCGLCTWLGPWWRTRESAAIDGSEHRCFALRRVAEQVSDPAEPRSILRMQAHTSGVCPVCSQAVPGSAPAPAVLDLLDRAMREIGTDAEGDPPPISHEIAALLRAHGRLKGAGDE